MTELLSTSLGLLIASFASIIAIANPLSPMAVFTTLTKDNTDAERAAIAKRTAIYMVVILTIFLLAGTTIKNFFGISLAGIRVAGGLIILQSAWSMLKPDNDTDDVPDKSHRAARKKNDISFTPLAMPLLAGPGSIAVVIGLASNSTTVLDFAAVIAAIILSAVVSYFVLRLGPISSKYIGPTGMDAITRMMGFIVMAIAIQFILSGIKDFFML